MHSFHSKFLTTVIYCKIILFNPVNSSVCFSSVCSLFPCHLHPDSHLFDNVTFDRFEIFVKTDRANQRQLRKCIESSEILRSGFELNSAGQTDPGPEPHSYKELQ